MLAVKRAKALIQSASFSMLNKIYANNIPDTENDNSHETMLGLTLRYKGIWISTPWIKP